MNYNFGEDRSLGETMLSLGVHPNPVNDQTIEDSTYEADSASVAAPTLISHNPTFPFMYDNLRNQDPEIFQAIAGEIYRQNDKIELIASENFTSRAVLEAQGSVLTNKYAEGYPGRRYYGGCEWVDLAESVTMERARRLFGAEYANVQPHSGSSANMAVYFSFLKHGDTVLGMDLSHGGHLTHGSPVNFSGKFYNFVSYGIDPATGLIDYNIVREEARKHRP